MKVSILGAGNVATQLALALKKAGTPIVQIYNRSDDAGIELARTVHASFTSNLNNLENADVYIVAVKDDAIAEIAGQLKLQNQIVAHTSGTKSKELLSQASPAYGIFYPLQTMTKTSKVDFKNVPLLVEGSDESVTAQLENLARTISRNVHRVDEQQRQWIHVAAVFANNFTNHLFGISEHIMVEHGMSFDILKPLIFNFVQSLEKYSPSEIQTGPAMRGDYQTIEKHLELLTDEVRLQTIYKVLTDSIIAQYHQKQF
jgi:predicted short-subunit dehydrogenase-like oxidoreductase (DUF2520 family)